MKIYHHEIEEPFTQQDIDQMTDEERKRIQPKVGDFGVYDKHVIKAKKQLAIMEIKTPFGTTWVNPKIVFKSKRTIYRHFKQVEPMRLFVITPKYDNKKDFEPKEEQGWTQEGVKKFLSIREKLGIKPKYI